MMLPLMLLLASSCSYTVSPAGRSRPVFAIRPATCAATVLVPLYSYPGADWTEIEAERAAHPGTAITAIVNPNNGPGKSRDPNYASGIAALQTAGVTVLGYDHTSYGARRQSLVKSDARHYRSWYAVDGIFFDEMASTRGHEAYYAQMSAYVRSLGMHATIGNPGADTRESYVGSVDSMVIFESAGYPPLARFGGWHTEYPASTWGSISYATGTLSISTVCAIARGAGYIYVTNGVLPNPYDTLPPYFDRLVSAL